MVGRAKKNVPAALFDSAEGQQGYFTAKQAAAAGYQLGSQAHHVKSGNWVRVERGIYRLARFPQSNEEQLVISICGPATALACQKAFIRTKPRSVSMNFQTSIRPNCT